MTLDELVATPGRNLQRTSRVEVLLDEAGCEKVRMARIAGHSLDAIAAAIRQETGHWIGRSAVREWLIKQGL